MKKITILALHLSTGGIERTIATLSNMLAKRYEVEIIANYQIDEKPAFKIDDRVKIKYLMKELKPNAEEFKSALKKCKIIQVLKEGIKAIKILYLRKKLMKEAVKNLSCDIAISTRDIHNRLLGKYAKKEIVKIAQEHNNNGNEKYIRKIVKSLKNIDYFMPVSKQLLEIYKEKLQKTNIKCMYIPHCLSNYPEETSKLEDKNIISVGRLSPEKGFLDLIDVYEIVSKNNPDWHLFIAGDGQEREKIEKKIQDKNLQEKVSLLGFQKQEKLNELFLQSSIYVMTSIHESFGLVLIEAESYGLPLLAFDTAEGPKEIIENEENGYLIHGRDIKEMEVKIENLISNLNLRKQMGENSRKKSEKYKMENIEKIWFDFIDNI